MLYSMDTNALYLFACVHAHFLPAIRRFSLGSLSFLLHIYEKTPDFCLLENAVYIADPRAISASNLGADLCETEAA